ncbi:hypothetical protein [Thalassobium sp. R2A62]|uniref:hypothetical protein n=1 Tax=Thalassobium sp. R2A62 TaxID=633131 RepID=UPI0001B1CA7A|nr:hypothetical protein [Thalassobium sp. R2A62]EET46334.1 hypothetical protein TR2A62_3186 [Thalassobium sp. R2A62]
MSKHLTKQNIQDIIALIGRMKGKITWGKITNSVNDKLNLPHAMLSLKNRPEIAEAYAARRSVLDDLEKQKKKVAKAPAPQLPENPPEHIEKLDERIFALEDRLHTVLYNAKVNGVDIVRMERPPTPVDFSPSKG